MAHSTRVVFIAQIFISAMMAGLMTGFFGLLKLGPAPGFLAMWGQSFVIAWPVAFAFSLLVGPVAFRLAWQVNRLLG